MIRLSVLKSPPKYFISIANETKTSQHQTNLDIDSVESTTVTSSPNMTSNNSS